MSEKKSEKGVRLAARYGYITNSLGYCGPKKTGQDLYNAVIGKAVRAAKKSLENFEALYPYLCLLAEKKGLEPFDERVVRAHFTGSALLEGTWQEGVSSLIRNTFSKRGLPEGLANRLASKVSKGIVPHHSFHVLFIHTITGRVPKTIETENNCLITPARFLENGIAERRFVLPSGKLSSLKKTNVQIDENFLGRLPRKGDYLALHWGTACEILTKSQAETLEKFNRRTLSEIFLKA